MGVPSVGRSQTAERRGKYQSNRAIQSGYIYILRLPRWLTITRVAMGLPGAIRLGIGPMAVGRCLCTSPARIVYSLPTPEDCYAAENTTGDGSDVQPTGPWSNLLRSWVHGGVFRRRNYPKPPFQALLVRPRMLPSHTPATTPRTPGMWFSSRIRG